MHHPLLFLGVDIAWKKDTAAVAAIYRHAEWGLYCLYGHRIFHPPVHIPHVTDCLVRLLETQRVGGILYDPFQYVAEAQRLAEQGYERILHEINQGAMMIEIGSNLESHIQRGSYIAYEDKERRAQYSWCGAKATERGYRIHKMGQNKPVDIVIAEAMALWGCSQDLSFISHPSYSEQSHSVSLLELP